LTDQKTLEGIKDLIAGLEALLIFLPRAAANGIKSVSRQRLCHLLARSIVAPLWCDDRERLSTLDPAHQLGCSRPAAVSNIE
jgi:hypothetical protein